VAEKITRCAACRKPATCAMLLEGGARWSDPACDKCCPHRGPCRPLEECKAAVIAAEAKRPSELGDGGGLDPATADVLFVVWAALTSSRLGSKPTLEKILERGRLLDVGVDGGDVFFIPPVPARLQPVARALTRDQVDAALAWYEQRGMVKRHERSDGGIAWIATPGRDRLAS
jgi:hypothetical protein